MKYNIKSRWLQEYHSRKEGLGESLRVVSWTHKDSGTAYEAIWVPAKKQFACLTCYSLHSTLDALAGHAEVHIRSRGGYVDNSEKYLGKDHGITRARTIKTEPPSSEPEDIEGVFSDVEEVPEEVVKSMLPEIPVVKLDSDLESRDSFSSESESESDSDKEKQSDGEFVEPDTTTTQSTKDRLAKLISYKPSSGNPMLQTSSLSKHSVKIQKLTMSPSSPPPQQLQNHLPIQTFTKVPDSASDSNLFVSSSDDDDDKQFNNNNNPSSSDEDTFISADEELSDGEESSKKRQRQTREYIRRVKFMEAHPELGSKKVHYYKIKRTPITQYNIVEAIFKEPSLAGNKLLPSWQRESLNYIHEVPLETLIDLQSVIANQSPNFEKKVNQDRRRLPKKLYKPSSSIPNEFLQFSHPSN